MAGAARWDAEGDCAATFTRDGLRCDSDKPQHSFGIRRDDVTIDGDVARIRDKSWRFESATTSQG